MDCPACGTPAVTFGVPDRHRDAAPGGAEAAALCPTCLTLAPVDDAGAVPDAGAAAFSRVVEGFPDGEPGVAMALAVGLLVDSVALNRQTVRGLFDAAADAGVDPWLVLERLAAAGTVQPDADLGRLRRQLEQLWG